MNNTEFVSNGFESAFSYKLIYIFRINDDEHNGKLKIGDATIHTNKYYDELQNNCNELNDAAKDRINEYTSTAGISYELLHTEIAVDNKKRAFRDNKVHQVLLNSGYKRFYFDTEKTQNEWFIVNLDTAINAINAVKCGRTSLTNQEMSLKNDPIILRPEQKLAVKKTIAQFKKGNRMLWNAKMRFGKTICALEVAKECQFEKTIILTHRPVVSNSWYDDFKKIFGNDDNYIFGSKTFGESLNNLLKSGKKFIYFASIQDLRGSEEVGGKFNKNNLVFETEWDYVVIDEAHEGTKTDKGISTIEGVIKIDDSYPTKILNLSGTPFNLLSDFNSDEIYTWDYIMEQEAKLQWNITHYGDYNPYEELPEMKIYTYDLDKLIPGYVEFTDKAFNFKEFFKVWTGDIKTDRKELKDNKIGTFVHKEDVLEFLNLLCKKDNNSNYPYSTSEFRDYFRHSLWMVPGVKEARALSKMLNEHPVFGSGAFKIINVAGNGDEEENYKDALEAVRKGIGSSPENSYSITLSCGKLTTGVSVPEWTSVFMLSGSSSTSASSYLQTIFRVQTPANIGGKIKEKCYVFDFAPDRSLKMLSQAGRLSVKAGSVDDKTIMGKFLNFCPVISVNGSKMVKYDVDKMLQQLKRAYADRVVANGFDDTHIYNDNLTKLDKIELEKFENLKAIIGASKPTKKVEDIDINKQGFTNEEYEKLKEIEKKKKHELTEEEKALLEERKKKKEQAYTAMTILRGISIRIPLLIYGANVPIETDITCDNFVDIIDDESWKEFMPAGVTKEVFKDFSKYYDADIFVEAGKRIRNSAKYADTLSPEERVKEIANIFSSFRNPDKETVLTPWRTVNMHMGDCIGGFNFFYNSEDTDYALVSFEEARFVSNGDVTQNILNNKNSKILELNSKTGLYPLYVTYSLFKHKALNYDSKKLSDEIEKQIWMEVVEDNIFVLCKTPMAQSITKRTLCGYNDFNNNIVFDDDLMNNIVEKPDELANRINKPKFWKKDGEKMDFDAIIGNPPYQLEGGSGGNNDSPMYQYFAELSDKINPKYSSLIMPARWFAAGRENLLGDFRKKMLSNKKMSKLYVYTQSRDVFPNVEIKGGVCYYLLDSTHNGKCSYHIIHDGIHEKYERNLDDFDVLIRDPIYAAIVKKVNDLEDPNSPKVDSIVSNDTPFGISSNVRNSKKNSIKVYDSETNEHNTKLYHIEKLVRKVEFVNRKDITKHAEDIDCYKVFIPGAGGSGNDPIVLGKPEFAERNSVCSQSYLYVKFDTESEAKNFIKYLKTKFFRTLVAAIKISQSAPNRVYRFVPMQDFTDLSDINWNANVDVIDQQLYKKYGITDEEENYINENIKYDELEKYSSNDKIEVFIKRNNEVIAKGEYFKGSLKVFKGSKIVPEVRSKSLFKMICEERKSKDLVNGIYEEDHIFDNPSRAATVILGQNSNGYNEWKTEDNISLNVILNRTKK